MEGFMTSFEKNQNEQKIGEIQSELNKWFEEGEKKYDLANPDAVLNRANAMADAGEKVTKEVIESLFKRDHEAYESKFKTRYAKRVEEQKRVNEKSKEVGSGGSPAGSPPPKYKSLKDVRRAMEASFEG
jgi:hypothetical protein